tara:strand:+ start:17110 stop:18051 length:942 start_codon:yes stop_codon:yes gene_type:complete
VSNKNQSRSIAICVGGSNEAKLGAMYFDYIIPIACEHTPREVFPPEAAGWSPPSSLEVVRKLQETKGNKGVGIMLSDDSGNNVELKLTDNEGVPDYEALEYLNEHLFSFPTGRAMTWLRSEMQRVGIADVPVLLRGLSLDQTVPTKTLSDVTLTIAGMPFINVEGVAWEQITAFRADPNARRELDQLRRYLSADLIQKTPEQVKAAVEQKFEEYNVLGKKHGFDVTVGVMQAICSVKTTISRVGGGAVIGAMLQNQNGFTVGELSGMTFGAMLGAVLEMGSITATVTQGLHERRGALRNHPVAYIINAKKQLH